MDSIRKDHNRSLLIRNVDAIEMCPFCFPGIEMEIVQYL